MQGKKSTRCLVYTLHLTKDCNKGFAVKRDLYFCTCVILFLSGESERVRLSLRFLYVLSLIKNMRVLCKFKMI